jgi:RNA polymerase sigma-70 factor, ECF subfamily
MVLMTTERTMLADKHLPEETRTQQRRSMMNRQCKIPGTGTPTSRAVVRIPVDSDQALVSAMAAGERTALAALYDRHAVPALSLAMRILGNRQDAEDLLHDVFLEVWRKAADYDPDRASVRAWLLLRVRSRAIDRLRALRNRTADDTDPDLTPAPAPMLPEHHAERDRVRQALATLTPNQRLVIELLYFEGLSCQEIAGRCGMPIGTVKSRLAAALERLRQALDPAAPPNRAAHLLQRLFCNDLKSGPVGQRRPDFQPA